MFQWGWEKTGSIPWVICSRAEVRFGRKFWLALGASFGSVWAQTARVLSVQGGGLIGAVRGHLW